MIIQQDKVWAFLLITAECNRLFSYGLKRRCSFDKHKETLDGKIEAPK